jgi:hypothetical protein
MSVIINGSAGVTTNSGAVYDGIQSDTAKTATGTSIDFTGIPSWAKRITVMFSGVSTNGTSVPLLQLGDSGGVEITGYLGAASTSSGAGTSNALYTAGFGFVGSTGGAANIFGGSVTITALDSTTNLWTCSGIVGFSNVAATTQIGGTKTLSATLDRVRITTVNGTDTFDAGSINTIYE